MRLWVFADVPPGPKRSSQEKAQAELLGLEDHWPREELAVSVQPSVNPKIEAFE